MGFFSNLFGLGPKVDFKAVVERGATIVDVRTPQEFATGNINGSINIPVGSLPHKLKMLNKKKPIIVYPLLEFLLACQDLCQGQT